MTIAFWCVLAMILFPYIFTILAKTGRHFNNHDPRGYLAEVTGWRKRANYIQLNSFEMTPAFSIGVIIATLAHAPQFRIDVLALIFVITRIFYAICYLTDKSTLRSLFWAMSLGCIVSLFLISLRF